MNCPFSSNWKLPFKNTHKFNHGLVFRLNLYSPFCENSKSPAENSLKTQFDQIVYNFSGTETSEKAVLTGKLICLTIVWGIVMEIIGWNPWIEFWPAIWSGKNQLLGFSFDLGFLKSAVHPETNGKFHTIKIHPHNAGEMLDYNSVYSSNAHYFNHKSDFPVKSIFSVPWKFKKFGGKLHEKSIWSIYRQFLPEFWRNWPYVPILSVNLTWVWNEPKKIWFPKRKTLNGIFSRGLKSTKLQKTPKAKPDVMQPLCGFVGFSQPEVVRRAQFDPEN